MTVVPGRPDRPGDREHSAWPEGRRPEPPAGLAPGEYADPPTEPIPTAGPLGSPPPIGRGCPDRPGFGWTELVTATVVYLVAQIGLGLAAIAAHAGSAPPAPWLVALSAVSALLAVGAAALLRVRSPAALGLRRVRPRVVATAVGLGVGVWVVSRVLIVVYVAATGDTSDPQRDLTVFSGPVAAALVTVLGGLLVPLGEELLFRGVGFGALRRYGVVVATIVSAGVFALAHGLNAVFAAALLLGVLNCVLYERTRSVWPCVAAHATFNLLSFGLLLALT